MEGIIAWVGIIIAWVVIKSIFSAAFSGGGSESELDRQEIFDKLRLQLKVTEEIPPKERGLPAEKHLSVKVKGLIGHPTDSQTKVFLTIHYIQYFSQKTSLIDISLVRAFSAVPMHALCGVMMGFLITLSIFEKKHNYINLFLAIFIPVGMHGLYNYSLASKVVSHQLANVILFVFFLRAIYLFRDMKKRQKETKMFHMKNYTITTTNFIQASTSVLLIYLGLNYLVSI